VVFSCPLHLVIIPFPFSAFLLTLLVGQHEGRLACKKLGVGFFGGDDLTGALHIL